MSVVENILNISHQQGHTCMFTREELETFSQDKLHVIYEGIKVLSYRRPFRPRISGVSRKKPKKKAK